MITEVARSSERALAIVAEWGNRVGVEVSVTKTVLPKVGGVRLPYVKSTKYLGVC